MCGPKKLACTDRPPAQPKRAAHQLPARASPVARAYAFGGAAPSGWASEAASARAMASFMILMPLLHRVRVRVRARVRVSVRVRVRIRVRVRVRVRV